MHNGTLTVVKELEFGWYIQTGIEPGLLLARLLHLLNNLRRLGNIDSFGTIRIKLLLLWLEPSLHKQFWEVCER